MSLPSLTMIEEEVSEEGTSRRVTSEPGPAIDQLTALSTLAQQMSQINQQMGQMNNNVAQQVGKVPTEQCGAN